MFMSEQDFIWWIQKGCCGLQAGVWRDRMWPDGWTAVTADGKRSAQFEHTLLVRIVFVWFF